MRPTKRRRAPLDQAEMSACRREGPTLLCTSIQQSSVVACAATSLRVKYALGAGVVEVAVGVVGIAVVVLLLLLDVVGAGVVVLTI